MRKKNLAVFILALVSVAAVVAAPEASAGDWTLGLELRGRWIEGKPLAWSKSRVYLLGRDGRLWQFAPAEAVNYRKTAPDFRPFSQAKMRGRLLHEFGPRFDVSGTGHYLVVHPAGQRDRWAERFEDLYRSFIHYFTARGFRPERPQFPLVAVVFPRQRDFVRYAAKEGVRVSSGVLGYYSFTSNRILLYDTASGSASTEDWRINAGTIIHEATHQTAFNTGIHNRLGSATLPTWVAEGLATMFEAPGVYDSRNHRQRSDRINRYRLSRFRAYAAGRRKSGALSAMISSDGMFQADPDAAYAQAWALTFFLAETRPRQYFDYLAGTASRPPLESYSAASRMKDFTDVFGGDMTMFDARLLRFVHGLAK